MAERKSIDILADRVDRLACSKCGHHMDLSDVEPFSEIVCPKCNTKQVAPMRLGSFLLIAEMGKGGMGSVYRAFDQTLGRYVAIKVMQKQLAEDKKFAENFIREARAAAALNHPNVVQIYSCSQEQGQLYIVMELVDGGRLDGMIEGGKALEEDFALDVGVQIAQGLQAANDIGLIHGDIKPANILFDKQMRAKVVDFGLARFAAQQQAQPGEIWGTPYYIAPEKVRSQKEDHRADIYSLGATLYHALTGSPPFEGDTAKDVVLARLKSPATSLLTVRSSLQPETADVIARMLEQDVGRRYPTYKSLLPDLEEALRVARQRHGRPAPDTRKGSRKWLIVGGLCVCAVAAGLYWGLGGEEEAPDATSATETPSAVSGESPAGEERPPTERPAPPEITYPEQPFPEEVQAKLGDAVEDWREGDVRDYETAMNEVFQSMPRVGVERAWVGVLQALPAWAEGRDRDKRRYLRNVQDAQLRTLENGQAHPGAMPQGVARLMTEQNTAAQLREVAEDWSAWFGALTDFVIAIQRLKEGSLDEAVQLLETYSDKEPGDVAWPYHYRVIADLWLETIEAWRDVAASAEQAEPEEAVKALRRFRREAPLFLYGAIDNALSEAEDRVREAEQARAEAEKEAREAQTAEEKALIEETRSDLYALIQTREFQEASREARRLESEIETEEGQEVLDALIENYDRIEELKKFIIRGIEQSPAPSRISSELTGETQGATLSGIEISVGPYGSMEREWSQVSERLMGALAEHYIAQQPEEEQARWLMSLALFAYESRGMRPAKLYADRAIALDADQEEVVRRLMPGLELD